MAPNRNCHHNLKILQWNCQGLYQNKIDELETFLKVQGEYDILAIQETLWTKENNAKIGEYNLVRIGERSKDTNDMTLRGTCTGIHPKHQHIVVREISNTFYDVLTIKLERYSKPPIYISNVYRKHNRTDNTAARTLGENFIREVKGPWQDHIICGDFNCHSTMWGSEETDTIGNAVTDWILDGRVIVLNEGDPTRIGDIRSRDTAIDIALVENQKTLKPKSWNPQPEALPSDHLPIVIEFGNTFNNRKTTNKTLKFKLHKANWEGFKEDSENTDWTQCRNGDLRKYLDAIIRKILELAKKHIPHDTPGTTIKPRKAVKTVPWWDEEIEQMKQHRNQAFKNYKQNKTTINYNIYKQERNKVKDIINKKRKQFYVDRIHNINASDRISDFWKLVKITDGNVGTPNTVAPLLDGNRTITDPKEKADTIAKHLQKTSSDENLNANFKLLKYKHAIEQQERLQRKTNNNEELNKKYSMDEFKTSLFAKSDTAAGDDTVSYTIIKHLSDKAHTQILELLNLIFISGNIPKPLKHAIVIPILKPDKDKHEAVSYRPISLTSHVGKILETMANTRLQSYLDSKGIIQRVQSGFQKKRQTLDHLARLTTDAETCKKQGKTTLAVFLDLEKAYDMMWRDGVLLSLSRINVNGQMFNYLRDFLRERTFQVRVNNELSETYDLENGVPQGAVLSPTLFNILINNIGNFEEKFQHLSLGQFADDTALWVKPEMAPKITSKYRFKRLNQAMKHGLNDLLTNLANLGFKVNVTKTQGIYFNGKGSHPITVGSTTIQSKLTVKYLGITLDSFLDYHAHIKNLVKKGENSLNLLIKMGAKRWGLKTKHKTLLYKNLILPKMCYGEELFPDNKKTTAMKDLDEIQNKALRIITNSPSSTSTACLEQITKIPPLDIRRTNSRLNLWARLKYNKNNPANAIYDIKDSPVSNHRIEKTLRDGVAASTIKHLKTSKIDQRKLSTHTILPNFWTYKKVNIDLSLSKFINKKTTNETVCRNLVMEHIDNNLKDHDRIYTDGSRKNNRVGAGIYCSSTNAEAHARLDDDLSITSAELVAIDMAIDHALSPAIKTDRKVAIMTDSKAALLSLKRGANGVARPDLVTKITQKLTQINDTKNIQVTLVWIPSHIGVTGNDKADAAANKGRDNDLNQILIGLSPKELKSLTKNYCIGLWQTRWDNDQLETVREFRKIAPKINTYIPHENSDAKINRLRLNRPFFRITDRRNICTECKSLLTTNHVLLACPLFEVERDKLHDRLEQQNMEWTMTTILRPHKDRTTKVLVRNLVEKIDETFEI